MEWFHMYLIVALVVGTLAAIIGGRGESMDGQVAAAGIATLAAIMWPLAILWLVWFVMLRWLNRGG